MRALVIAVLALTWLPIARAGAQSFGVTAEIVPGCALTGAQGSNLDFGSLAFGAHPAAVPAQVPASAILGGSAVTLDCTANLALSVVIDGGLHASGGQRRLSGAGAFLPYALYTDAGLATPISAGVAVPVSVPPTGALAFPVHGLATVPGGLMPGLYTDTLNVTISW